MESSEAEARGKGGLWEEKQGAGDTEKGALLLSLRSMPMSDAASGIGSSFDNDWPCMENRNEPGEDDNMLPSWFDSVTQIMNNERSTQCRWGGQD